MDVWMCMYMDVCMIWIVFIDCVYIDENRMNLSICICSAPNHYRHTTGRQAYRHTGTLQAHWQAHWQAHYRRPAPSWRAG